MRNKHLWIGCVLLGSALSAAVDGDLRSGVRACCDTIRTEVRHCIDAERDLALMARITMRVQAESERAAATGESKEAPRN